MLHTYWDIRCFLNVKDIHLAVSHYLCVTSLRNCGFLSSSVWVCLCTYAMTESLSDDLRMQYVIFFLYWSRLPPHGKTVYNLVCLQTVSDRPFSHFSLLSCVKCVWGKKKNLKWMLCQGIVCFAWSRFANSSSSSLKRTQNPYFNASGDYL